MAPWINAQIAAQEGHKVSGASPIRAATAADFLALLTVAEFTRDAVDWRQMSLPFPPDDAETGRELDYLLDLAKSYRSGERLAEIIDQNLGFPTISCFRESPASHHSQVHSTVTRNTPLTSRCDNLLIRYGP